MATVVDRTEDNKSRENENHWHVVEWSDWASIQARCVFADWVGQLTMASVLTAQADAVITRHYYRFGGAVLYRWARRHSQKMHLSCTTLALCSSARSFVRPMDLHNVFPQLGTRPPQRHGNAQRYSIISACPLSLLGSGDSQRLWVHASFSPFPILVAVVYCETRPVCEPQLWAVLPGGWCVSKCPPMIRHRRWPHIFMQILFKMYNKFVAPMDKGAPTVRGGHKR